MSRLLINVFLKNKDKSTLSGRESYGKLAGIVGVICNLILSIAKFIIGAITNSIAILADATNNVSDAGSSVITLIGFRLSEMPADKKHPYGHARFEYITGLIISFFIINIGLNILGTSIKKVISPEKSIFSITAVIVLLASIIVKLWLSSFNYKLSKEIDSEALKATAADSRNDCISTGAVLISTLVSHYFNINLDGFMGIIVAVFILISGVQLTKETISPLLGQAPSKELCRNLKEKILSYDNILGVHDLIVHSYGPNQYFASAHLEMDAKLDVLFCHDVMDQIERDILKEDKIHLVVHLDPTVLDNEETNKLKETVRNILKEIDPIITFHDFRVVLGQNAKNVIFDIVVPPGYKYSDEEISDIIKNRVNEAGNGNLYAVITVDKSYGEETIN